MEGEHESEPLTTGDVADASPDGASVGAITPAPAALPEPTAAAAPPPPPAPPPYVPPPSAPPEYAPYSPPPTAAPMPMPPTFAPPPAAKKGGSRGLLIGAVVAVLLILVLGGGAVLANASLSSTYSPKAAVSDFFAAQARGDVNGMWSNATFMSGGGSDNLFSKDAVTAMMATDKNKAISNVSVTSTQDLDSSTSKVSVSMAWSGTQITHTYTVTKDTTRVHDLFYYSWRVVIPAQAITVTLPNQPGDVQVDGISVASPSSVQVIQGYHTVKMLATDIYDEVSETANASDGGANASFTSQVGQGAFKAASDSVNKAFANETCDASKYFDCPNHKYTVPAGYYDTLPAAGGDIRANSSWTIVFNGDPTTGMKLIVTTDAGKVTASGTCAMTLTVDGNRTYQFTGSWTGTLTFSSAGVASDIVENCDSTKA
jgi:hypothetical protein